MADERVIQQMDEQLGDMINYAKENMHRMSSAEIEQALNNIQQVLQNLTKQDTKFCVFSAYLGREILMPEGFTTSFPFLYGDLSPEFMAHYLRQCNDAIMIVH